MAIDQNAIKNELLDFHNHKRDYSGLATNSDPVFIQERTALLWKNIIKKGFTAINPSSSTVISASESIYSSLNNSYAGVAFYAFYASAMLTIGNGMSGYSTMSLPIPLILSAPIEDKESSCNTLASQLVACAKTGISVMTSPPNTIKNWN